MKSFITAPVDKKEKNNNLKNSKDIFDNLNNEEDDVDDEELKLKLQELQRELRELDNKNDNDDDISKTQIENMQAMQLIVSNTCVRSRSTSLVSSESGSCSSSKSNCSFSEGKPIHHKNYSFKLSSTSSVNKDKNHINDVNYQLSHVSSSTNVNNNNNNNSGNIRKLDNVSVETKRSNEVKLDRHGNVRVSLVEQERQKRLRAERFRFGSANLDKSRKRTADQIEVSVIYQMLLFNYFH